MDVTAEISLYPFDEEFKDKIKQFIEKLENDNPGLLMQVNAMSTQIAGPYDRVMDLLWDEMEEFLLSNDAAFVLKITKGCRIE